MLFFLWRALGAQRDRRGYRLTAWPRPLPRTARLAKRYGKEVPRNAPGGWPLPSVPLLRLRQQRVTVRDWDSAAIGRDEMANSRTSGVGWQVVGITFTYTYVQRYCTKDHSPVCVAR